MDRNEWHVILKSGKVNVTETPYYRYLKQRSDELDRMRADIALGRHLVDMGVSNQIDIYLIECLSISTWNDGRHDDDPQHSFIYDTLGRLYVLKKQPYEAIAYFTWTFNRFRAEHQAVEANEAL
ncbi:unnamed protein product [Rotaria sp. Silwood1]|nr:unnamed protein product [Rotaria sp. Silwood1]CAF1661780.1 unnamed protein product [Rotaria sp. Silwood1]CAF3920361.1 unnamed protein product [Rotaria sp. Silwood1]CAF4978635.1 unnamed protein product [Rotaria sp. Silwood1]CAF5007849.1 unnamed protein product [Rotaria sp. Silwood1]